MTESDEDMQSMLNILNQWCRKWGMSVNSNKTKVVHFRNSSTPRTTEVFICGQEIIEVIDRYRYLGGVSKGFCDTATRPILTIDTATRPPVKFDI